MDKEIIREFYHKLEKIKKCGVLFRPSNPLSHSEFAILYCIDFLKREDEKITTSLLSENLGVTKSAISQTMNTLEDKDLIIRKVDKADRRVFTLSLTEQGSRIIEEEKIRIMSKMEKVLDKMGEENTIKLLALYDILTDCMESVLEEEQK